MSRLKIQIKDVPEEKRGWLSTNDIPENQRQGRYSTSWENSYDYTEQYKVTHYIATDEEQAIIEANIQAQKNRAEALFSKVPAETYEAIENVIDNATNHTSYPHNAFAKADFTGASSYIPTGFFSERYERGIDMPEGPGATMRVDVRATKGVENPNIVEAVKRRSIVDGLDLMFPKEALISHFNHFLSMPFLHRQQEMNRAFQIDLGSINFKFQKFLDAMIDHWNQDNGFKVRSENNDNRQMLDRNNSGSPSNMHQRNIVAIAEFLKEKPEYLVALFMWTEALVEYCRDLKSFVRTEMGANQQEILKQAPFWDTVALVEGGNHEKKHFYESGSNQRFSRIDQGNSFIPTTGPNSFFYVSPVVSVIMGALLEECNISGQTAHTEDVDFNKLKSAMKKLSVSGMFQRRVNGENDQPILIRCPMSRKLGEWLCIDLGNNGRAEDQVFAKFLAKVRQDTRDPKYNMSKHFLHIAKSELEKRFKGEIYEDVKERVISSSTCPFQSGPG